MGRRRLLLLACLLTAAFAGLATTASAKLRYAHAASYPGVQHLHLKFGPVHIKPGQNSIYLDPMGQLPSVPGYITRFKPNMKRLDGSIPPVDVLHLHHAVWLVNGRPTFAVGEEKTIANMPQGYGFHYSPRQSWLMNHMLHNLTPNPDTVNVTWDIDFVPDTAPAAASIKRVQTVWVDAEGGQFYPVFDVHKGSGHKGKYTFPTDARNPYPGGMARNTATISEDGTLVATAGHLHPGGLNTDLYLTRNGKRIHLFRSDAHYYEPAGAVSWDVSMTQTPANWRVAVKAGDVLSVTGTYDSGKASWYEVMAIMATAFAPGDTSGVDPFTHRVDRGTPLLTHGHLPENNNHGGGPTGLPDPGKLLDGPVNPGTVGITNFAYKLGDFSAGSRGARPPVIKQGQSLTFLNNDSGEYVFHTITGCKSPCNRSVGIAYPIANGAGFDSGELGHNPPGVFSSAPAANRDTWSTPANLRPGTYAYFCRIHPFMRGSFRVVKG